ncbi:MAG: methyltransferase domain-containing protein [Phycisphaerae bacterium]|nr:methyltransferase domain-containing protein [Phycisphaerae bacterium]
MKKQVFAAAKAIVPMRVRERVRTLGPYRWVFRKLFAEDTRYHDRFYTQEYYDGEMKGLAGQSADPMARAIVERFRPASVIDVGCGTGEYLAAFGRLGVGARGVELADAALRACRDKGVEARKFDLTKEPSLPWKADLAYSFEVAEHLPEKFANRYVGMLTGAASRHVVITAASPGQEGVNHFNCRPKSYWIDLFAAAGFAFDGPQTEQWEAENKRLNLAPWFWLNLLVFARR